MYNPFNRNSGRGVRHVGSSRVVRQAPPSGPPIVNIVSKGICDNAGVWAALGGGTGLLSKLIFRNLDVAPFTRGDCDAGQVGLIGLRAVLILNSYRATQLDARQLLGIAETMMPFLPESHFLPQAEARAEFIRIAKLIYADNKTSLIGYLTAAFGAGGPLANDVAYWNSPNVTDDAPISVWMHILIYLAEQQDDSAQRRATALIVLMLVSLAWRGMVTGPKLNKFMGQLDAVTPGITSLLERDRIEMVYNVFGGFLNDQNVGAIFESWFNMIPPAAIRAKVTLQQAMGSGLTSLDVIAQAIHLYPRFSWHKIGRLFPHEWEKATNAIRAVGSNKWYGFRLDLGDVKSTLYRHISWVCKELLIRSGTEPGLAQKVGWLTRPMNHDILNKMIEEFLASDADPVDLTTAPTQFESEESDEIVNLVAVYPRNTELAFGNEIIPHTRPQGQPQGGQQQPVLPGGPGGPPPPQPPAQPPQQPQGPPQNAGNA